MPRRSPCWIRCRSTKRRASGWKQPRRQPRPTCVELAMPYPSPKAHNPLMYRLTLTLALLAGLLTDAAAAPKIENWTTDNGLRVFYAQSPGLPIVDFRLVFDAGSARDGAKSGLAALT